MSQALLNKVAALESRLDQFMESIVDNVQKMLADSEKAMIEQVADVLEDRNSTLEKMRKQIEDIYILRGAIARDCMAMLGRQRPPIDPRKVPMPHTLRRLGFLPPEERDDAA